MFLQVCVCPRWGGISACLAGGIPACLAAGLRGGAIPACIAGGIPACLAPGLQRGGCLLPVGLPAQGGLLLGGSAPRGEPPPPHRSRRLLLRTVRILLECILVYYSNQRKMYKKYLFLIPFETVSLIIMNFISFYKIKQNSTGVSSGKCFGQNIIRIMTLNI